MYKVGHDVVWQYAITCHRKKIVSHKNSTFLNNRGSVAYSLKSGRWWTHLSTIVNLNLRFLFCDKFRTYDAEYVPNPYITWCVIITTRSKPFRSVADSRFYANEFNLRSTYIQYYFLMKRIQLNPLVSTCVRHWSIRSLGWNKGKASRRHTSKLDGSLLNYQEYNLVDMPRKRLVYICLWRKLWISF